MGWRHARFGIVRFTKDVAVIGIGRGTASALLREAGCSVMGLTGSALLASIRAGKCPSRNRLTNWRKCPRRPDDPFGRGKPTRSSRWAPLRSHIETNLDHVTGLLHPWCPTRQGPRPDPAQMVLRHQRFRAPLPELHVFAHRRGIILLCPERIAEGAAGLKDLPDHRRRRRCQRQMARSFRGRRVPRGRTSAEPSNYSTSAATSTSRSPTSLP